MLIFDYSGCLQLHFPPLSYAPLPIILLAEPGWKYGDIDLSFPWLLLIIEQLN